MTIEEPERGRADRDFLYGLQKGLTVIECFDDENERLTSAEVAVRTGLSRAAARRCLLTLHKLGYANYDGKLFTLTPRILRLGYAYFLSAPLPQLLQPFLEHLNEKVHESCSAGVVEGEEIIYLARATSKRTMSMGMYIGMRLPAYCTSMGRVLLASLEPEDALERLAKMKRPRLTPKTCTDLEELSAILDRIRHDGYCIIDQELEVGLIAISVPIYNSAGNIVAAVNIASSSDHIVANEMVDRFLPSLLNVQKELRPLVKA